ncbi:alpha/beta hydrolase [Aurantimonas sp. A2-1-M11]|uniref:alpha/beta hydrolase n=1 Tax=Aurantimonas sp. A2-1-M11 TaxID=3113712 RepID=UPI002F94D6CD
MLDPQAKAVLDDLARKAGVQVAPESAARKLAKARAMTGAMADYSGAPPEGVSAQDLTVPGPGGAIGVRLYRPQGVAVPTLLVWYHGGGAMAGSLDGHDVPLRQLAAATGRAIASVDYRLAPEHPHPAPQDDCLAATRALLARAADLGCDPARVAIGGDSIGGLLAAVVALALRDAGDAGGAPEAMVLLYPNTDLRPDRRWPSLAGESGHVMTRRSLAYENDLFVPAIADRHTPSASPLLAPDVSRLPRALVVTCEHDPLRDEGEAFAARLVVAGGRVTQRREAGMIHGLLQMDGWIDRAADLRRTVADFLA